jgi:general nucleoside transport system ATP-binding protein
MSGIESVPGTERGADPDTPRSAAVELRGITKRFGSVVACNDVDLVVQHGEIHSLLGQNGAGKTTLMKILLGLVSADAGRIHLRGRPVVIRDPLAAASMGLAMVHQHFSVIGPLRVWENIALGERGPIDAKAIADKVSTIGQRYGLEVDPFVRVEDLTIGQRQRVEIIKALTRDPDVLILDEPTSVLTMAESDELFAVLRRVVRDEGRAVILISHKLDEILRATDRVTVMREGEVVARHDTAQSDEHELAREMLGREVSLRSEGAAIGLLSAVAARGDAAIGTDGSEVVLRIREAEVVDAEGRKLLDGVSFDVHRGEILGLAGMDGNGQEALGDLFSSLVRLDRGIVEVRGQPIPTGRAGAMHKAGVGVIPSDRHTSGCVLDMSVAENLLLSDLDTVSPGPLLNRRRIRKHAAELINRFDVRTPSTDTLMRSLSGGNQQRLVVARELSRSPAVLVASQPTRGLDVGAIEYVTGQLRAAAERGVGVLLISSELEEILDLAHRIAVIYRGRIIGVMPRSEVSVERLGMWMGGQVA